MYEIIKLLHLAAAITWLGGMGVMLFALRPGLAALAPPERLALLSGTMGRFFMAVWASIAVLLATGVYMFGSASMAQASARAAKAALANLPGMPPIPTVSLIPIGWHVMLFLGVVMFALFGHIYFASFKKLQRAVAASDWATGAALAAKIHPFMLANFCLGWLAIAAVRLWR